MNARERIRRAIARQPTDRIGISDPFWWETERDFHAQGMPEALTAEEYLDLDIGMFWFDQSFLLPRQVLEEHDEHRIVTDEWGTRCREFKDHQSTPGPIDFAVKDRAA